VRILIFCIRVFDSISNRVITFLFRLQQLLTGLLPVLAPPAELTELIQAHYAHTYRNAPSQYPAHSPIWTLEPWEDEVLARHMDRSNRYWPRCSGGQLRLIPLPPAPLQSLPSLSKVASVTLRTFPLMSGLLAASIEQKPTRYMIRLGSWGLAQYDPITETLLLRQPLRDADLESIFRQIFSACQRT
jgi:hypothetical protein